MTDYTGIIGIIGASGTILSAIALLVTISITFKIHKDQKKLSQRQLILPLWEYISSINNIDHRNPVVPDVIRAVNTLELIALLCEGEIIDEQIIKRTFSEQYIKHYENIERCGILKGCGHDGKSLLKENKAAMQFYLKMNNEFISSNAIKT